MKLISDRDFANWQKIYVGSDLILSRAGGVTVQDAVACGTPVICVDEPGQWQTEKMKEACRLHGIAPTVSYHAFRGAAIGPILNHIAYKEQLEKARQIMNKYEPDCGLQIAQAILRMVVDKNPPPKKLRDFAPVSRMSSRDGIAWAANHALEPPALHEKRKRRGSARIR